ncbi:sporulation related domain protein [Formosa agariphila KMM 3901]|uniref:Sporulation related domain protein n=1 Tax=Formosa agariphila (strain DSM 15362 / KCTC 12365 / LMG 23005 / KMM 3901 / M-2Alg 35-1) TaxID=1347342 RepID=T2KRS5_FORAG|nr:SPOR domain-containing protein [Formosa agariphila]CDF81181.1 sporulation related domain protein [Formosa agariphila KMM 3901]
MQLETYISDLLYRYECVIVPEFGAFLTQRVSAKINADTNTFFPPKKAISFNEQIQQNDGLLAHYVADVEKIPFEIALEKIKKRVVSIKSQLVEKESISLENIGELALNEEGKITFEPFNHLNYLTDAFGLNIMVSPAISREEYKQEIESIEKVIPLTFTPERRKTRPYLRYAAIAVLALGLSGFLGSKYYVNQVENHNQIAQETANTQLEHKIQEATFVIENPLPAVSLTVTKPVGTYHIIAGAFRVEENCEKIVSDLKSEGFNARKIGVNKYGLHQVVYDSYEDRKEALNALREIRRNNNPHAWLLVKDLK